MNVYDFDKTIYDGDSTIDFYLHCLRRHPHICMCIPKQIIGLVRYKMKKIDKTQFKSMFFSFLIKLGNPEKDVISFWNKNDWKIKSWYLKRKQRDDVIISASPEFLLRVLCDRLGIEYLIASDVNIHTGKFISKNCYGKEKSIRFCEKFGNIEITEFYSDSYSDRAMAIMARDAYIVKKNKIEKWKL